MTDEIETILNAYHSQTLWEMARAAGLEATGSGKKLSKAELLPKMRAEFFTRERVLASCERLGKREREVLNRLLLRGGEASSRSFQRELVRAGLVTPTEDPIDRYHHSGRYAGGYTGDPSRAQSSIFEDIIARLTYHGLVFSRNADPTTSWGTVYKLKFHPASVLYVPRLIQRYLPEPVPVAMPDLHPARVQTAEPALFLRDLYLYWDFVRRNQVDLVQGGWVGKRWLKAIDAVLLVPDPGLKEARREDEARRLHLVHQLLESLKLVHSEGGQLRMVGPDALHIPPFWSRDPTEQLRACLAAWPQLSELKELGIQVSTYNPHYTHARQIIVSVLKTLPTTAWFEPGDLLERAQGQDVDFLFPGHSHVESYPGPYYYGDAGGGYYYGEVRTLLETFAKFEREFVNECLVGFLHPLGIVELGYGSESAGRGTEVGDGALQAFRLTLAGKAVLGGGSAETPAETEQGKLVVQPNFQLLALGPVSLSLLASLDLFSEREQADRGAFQYRLSRESVYRAQQLGLDVSSIIHFLTGRGNVELPQNVRRSMEEWASHLDRFVFRSGVSLLQAVSSDLLTELMEGAATGQFLARSLAPDVALIKKDQVPKLVGALVEQGVFPAVSGAQPQAADKSVIVQENGIIRPIHAVPSLHLRGRLSRLAEEAGDGAWRLTAASVRRAGGSRSKVLSLLDELGKLQRGVLPDTLVEQIKAWGGYYGNADAETLTLIEFTGRAVLDELAQRPDLRPLLTPFPGGERALAIIAEGKLAQVKEILARYGVNVASGLRRKNPD